jgi:hypothetical protein
MEIPAAAGGEFVCPVCGKQMKSPVQYKIHVKTHETKPARDEPVVRSHTVVASAAPPGGDGASAKSAPAMANAALEMMKTLPAMSSQGPTAAAAPGSFNSTAPPVLFPVISIQTDDADEPPCEVLRLYWRVL